jgi:hypothetical protein
MARNGTYMGMMNELDNHGLLISNTIVTMDYIHILEISFPLLKASNTWSLNHSNYSFNLFVLYALI